MDAVGVYYVTAFEVFLSILILVLWIRGDRISWSLCDGRSLLLLAGENWESDSERRMEVCSNFAAVEGIVTSAAGSTVLCVLELDVLDRGVELAPGAVDIVVVVGAALSKPLIFLPYQSLSAIRSNHRFCFLLLWF